jgi:poly-gamma-glutamate capsule biosynthesis protein CapA/YwtB (metallophosphatase superfamily)
MWTRRAFLAGLSTALLAQTPVQRTRMLFGGDVLLARAVARTARQHNDPAWPFRDLAALFAAADIACVNLESPFSDQGPTPRANMIFKAEPDLIAGLELAGIDVVSTANNHARDQRGYGLTFTLQHLAAHGIIGVGTGATVEAAHAGAVLERHGIRYGFLAYTYDANNGNWPDEDRRVAVIDQLAVRRDVAQLKTRADAVIVLMHGGWEYHRDPNPQQRSFAKAAMDAGAAAVIGHHPHVTQHWDWYGDGVIFYSLGNLVFDQSQLGTRVGMLAELTFEGARLVDARERAVQIVDTVPRLYDSKH